MKLSDHTIKIIENFSNVNPHLRITKGDKNIIVTSPDDTVQAVAHVPEEFNNNIYLSDVKQFLGVLSSCKEPNIELQDKCMRIVEGRTSVKLSYCDEEVIKYRKELMRFPENAKFSFDLDKVQLANIMKFSSVLKLDRLKIYSRDGKLYIHAYSSINPNASDFEEEVGVGDTTEVFRIKREKLNLIEGDYTVEVAGHAVKFTHKTMNIVYGIGYTKS